jgi:hypothetical protein
LIIRFFDWKVEEEMEIGNPTRVIVIGFFMVLFGFVGPFLMVLDILPTTYFLSFLSYGSSIGGLFLGIIGTASLVRVRRREDNPEAPPKIGDNP